MDHYSVFSVDERERGETDLIEMDTGSATPKKQPPGQMPFAAH